MPHPTIPKLRTTQRDKALKLLRGRPAWMSFVVVAAGSGLPFSWVTDFASGRRKDPSSNKVETLIAYFEEGDFHNV